MSTRELLRIVAGAAIVATLLTMWIASTAPTPAACICEREDQ